MDPRAAEPHAAAVPRWALHRRLYCWMLSFADSRFGLPALFLFSVCESVFFPVPSLALQIPMTLQRKEKAWWHAGVNLAGSVVGGAAGYALAKFALSIILGYLGKTQADIEQAQPLGFLGFHSTTQEWIGNHFLLLAGALVIHPFKVFALACGALGAPLAGFFIAILLGRGILFFGVAGLLFKFGAPVRVFIDRWFNWICLALGLVLAAVALLPKLAH